MGLDMYAYAAAKEDSAWNDGNHRELTYWRKHPNLHGWMEELYRAKGGNVEMFNGVELELTWEDLEVLERDILLGNYQIPVDSSLAIIQTSTIASKI
jgi:hypothetical protein